MALMRRRPYEFDPFRNLMRIQDEINRLFDFSMGRPFIEGVRPHWSPSVDVYEDEKNLVVKAELPGLSEKDIELNIKDNNLVIKGRKTREEEKKEQNYYQIERTYGEFYRSIPLPATVDSEKVKASFKQGILEIEMPKKEEAKPKQIEIKAA